MENATKALLIAASVLIVILLISLGVGVFNTAQEQMGEADLSEYEIQKHNDKFNKYIGENQTGAEVNALLKTVFNHNNAQADSTTCVKISGAATIAASNSVPTQPKVSTASKYKVTVATYSSAKLITEIKIEAIK